MKEEVKLLVSHTLELKLPLMFHKSTTAVSTGHGVALPGLHHTFV